MPIFAADPEQSLFPVPAKPEIIKPITEQMLKDFEWWNVRHTHCVCQKGRHNHNPRCSLHGTVASVLNVDVAADEQRI